MISITSHYRVLACRLRTWSGLLLDREGMVEQTFPPFVALTCHTRYGVARPEATSADPLIFVNTTLNRSATQKTSRMAQQETGTDCTN